MSYARSPRPVCSITIGTSIIHPFHTPALKAVSSSQGRIEMVRITIVLTGDTENRGFSRCGFLSGFYRGPHPVSNERVLLRMSVLIVWPALPVPDLVLQDRKSTRLNSSHLGIS